MPLIALSLTLLSILKKQLSSSLQMHKNVLTPQKSNRQSSVGRETKTNLNISDNSPKFGSAEARYDLAACQVLNTTMSTEFGLIDHTSQYLPYFLMASLPQSKHVFNQGVNSLIQLRLQYSQTTSLVQCIPEFIFNFQNLAMHGTYLISLFSQDKIIAI